MKLASLLLAGVLLVAAPLASQDRVDLDAVTRIRLEGLHHSRVMETASGLMDGIGPRLTGSPKMKEANDWTRRKLEEWGLSNAHLESWGPFGRGWTYEESSVRMIRPDSAQLLAIPEAWTPGTKGPVTGSAVHLKASSKEELEPYRGKLAGKIVFFGEAREVKPHEKADSSRYDAKELNELEQFDIAETPRYDREEYRKRRALRKIVDKFVAEEKALAIVVSGRSDGGILGVQGAGTWKKGDPVGIPDVAMALEHFGRIVRLLDRKEEVTLELDIRARLIEDDLLQYNTIAEIPGTDRKAEVVMLGAHLDSWHAGTGATDNGAGVAATMEAVRILKAIGARPRRTIRIALWSGEEEGLFGSQAYVAQHFAARSDGTPMGDSPDGMPSYLRPLTAPLTVKPEHASLSAYFNMDNGTGRIRGIYAQENAAVVPIFESWLAPLKDLGATTVTMRDTGGTDHVAFDRVGLPGFQFIQDEVEYETRTHHTNQDVYERLQREDLMQASVVIATFVYEAAMRETLLPRKPMPKPKPAEPAEKGPLAKPAAAGDNPSASGSPTKG